MRVSQYLLSGYAKLTNGPLVLHVILKPTKTNLIVHDEKVVYLKFVFIPTEKQGIEPPEPDSVEDTSSHLWRLISLYRPQQ